ncbi:VOC family protein [Ancylobacter oerskovii]|uniref:VOC family protein n=1 Tax=Ancylobacter oerskovii TaxID=459519 RepID=A0ABW4YY70_9HYPH|nr:VOC family protein [Ancylobacter oerskovii]MBS7541959.1 VOC family protein [Ancylobacter oerskovii]
MSSLILYVTLGISAFDRTLAFYDPVMATLDHVRSEDATPGWAGYGPDYDGGVSLWLCHPFDGGAPAPGNGPMVAFRAASAEQVDAFHAAALAHGGTSEGAPGLRPHYTPHFYVAYVRDPDGNKLAAVFHRYGLEE